MDFSQLTAKISEHKEIVMLAGGVIVLVSAGLILYPYFLKKTVISVAEYRKFPLVEKIETSHNTRIFKFGLPSPNDTLGLPLGQHVSFRAFVDGNEVKRKYTPISSNEVKGRFEVLIKVYPSPYGLMSRHLDSLEIGDTIDVLGPTGHFKYTPSASPRIFGMVCGGTGLTPMWQVFNAVLKDEADKTVCSLIFANVDEKDILLKDDIDDLAKSFPQKFKVFYVLNNPPAGWTGGQGFVTKEHIEKQIGPYSAGNMCLMCGPPPMNKATKENLKQLNYPDSAMFTF